MRVKRITRMAAPVAAVLLWLVLGVAALAQVQGPTQGSRGALIDALGIPALLDVMRSEGQSYGVELGVDFLPDGGGATWGAVVMRLYDPVKMRMSVAQALEDGIPAQHLDPLLAFFNSATGKRIVEQEILAREAFLDAAAEEAARATFRDASDAQADRLALLKEYVAINDLVEFNVAGALTANLRFYRGLVEGGAIEMSEEEMLAEVWEQESEIRADTEEWLMSYLLMAYAPLSDAEVGEYVALSGSEAGQALNRALFVGFDAMYADLSYALGLAVAQQMKGEDL